MKLFRQGKGIKYLLAVTVLWQLFFSLKNDLAVAVNAQEIIRLKKAGLSENAIQKIITSDAVTRSRVSVGEIVAMKEAALSDAVILAFVRQEGAFASESERRGVVACVGGRDPIRMEKAVETRPKEFEISAEDVLRLIGNPEIVRLVEQGRLDRNHYKRVVKYLTPSNREGKNTATAENILYPSEKNLTP